MNLINIYRKLHKVEHTLFKSSCNTINYKLMSHKTNLLFKRPEIMQSMFCIHSGIKLGINNIFGNPQIFGN